MWPFVFLHTILSRVFSFTLSLLYTPFDLAVYVIFSLYHLARTHLHTYLNPTGFSIYTSRLLGQLYARAVPRGVQNHIAIWASIARQLSHLLLGRFLADLPPTARVPLDSLRGKHAIVTGANSGIGLHIALSLAKRGASVVLACRSQSRAAAARQHILWNVPEAMGRVSVMALDTADSDAVKLFAVAWAEVYAGLRTRSNADADADADAEVDDEAPYDGDGDSDTGLGRHRRIDILVHNAGVTDTDSELVDDGDGAGVEALYATNFLGSFLLTYLLEPYLSPDARVIFTSSTAQLWARFNPDFALGPVRGVCEPGFHTASTKLPLLGLELWNRAGSARYGMTKAMQCAMAKCLQRRWDAQDAERDRRKRNNNSNHNNHNNHPPIPHPKQNKRPARWRRTAHAFTPGFTDTPIFAKFAKASWYQDFIQDPRFALMRLGTALATDVEQGAATGVWLACAQDASIREGRGGYWDRMRREFSVADRMSDEMLARLWTRWEKDAGIEWR